MYVSLRATAKTAQSRKTIRSADEDAIFHKPRSLFSLRVLSLALSEKKAHHTRQERGEKCVERAKTGLSIRSPVSADRLYKEKDGRVSSSRGSFWS